MLSVMTAYGTILRPVIARGKRTEMELQDYAETDPEIWE